MIFRRTATGLAIVLMSASALAACKGKTTVGGTTVVTVTQAAPSPSPTSSSATSSGATAGASSTGAGGTSTAGPAPTGMTKLPGRCETLLGPAAVADAIGRAIKGKTAFVVGTPDKTTGRVGYVNCRYGIAKDVDDPGLEIGVSLYKTPGQANARIPLTITDFENNSATATKTTVNGVAATMLTGGTTAGYGPSIVLSYGQRTIAVTFRDGEVTAADMDKDLVALAALAISRTAPK